MKRSLSSLLTREKLLFLKNRGLIMDICRFFVFSVKKERMGRAEIILNVE